jgi:hypothetical protein
VEWVDAGDAVRAFEAALPGDRLRGSDFQGFDRTGWEDETWILHPMFELANATDRRTYDEAYRKDALDTIPADELGQKLRSIVERPGSVLAGARSGLAADPGPGWERVRWSEYLGRVGGSLTGHEYPPSYAWFPFLSWPVSVQSPCEGSMDIATLTAVSRVIAQSSETGGAAEAVFFFAGAFSPEAEPRVARGQLDELPAAIADHALVSHHTVAPQNIWSADSAWFTYTDIDFMATKVCGSSSLIGEIRELEGLETLDWSIAGAG